jgi:hypothetical protein
MSRFKHLSVDGFRRLASKPIFSYSGRPSWLACSDTYAKPSLRHQSDAGRRNAGSV